VAKTLSRAPLDPAFFCAQTAPLAAKAAIIAAPCVAKFLS
jgi:hypothetical protein